MANCRTLKKEKKKRKGTILAGPDFKASMQSAGLYLPKWV
jgi:hypothetical protein